ncbi:MAG TPA: hydantoinase/oxoprolinase family protein [Terriglobales bacterium]|nr:hydantoinase/oxoprolinase family protein [Terriglobales bacterium]
MPASRLQAPRPPIRLAVDTGGTFTDCVWVERGKLRIKKVFSTGADPSQAILEALAQITGATGIVLLHGTTVGTNTLLQRRGARVAFITTEGFEDIIEIGRQNRPRLYDLSFQRVPPLVERELRFGIAERVAADGTVLQRPSREQLQLLARSVHSSGAEALAVCTLFSFANAENEKIVGRVLEELGLPLSLSHVILPEFREYERASTVVMNAYLQPVMQGYLQRLEAGIRQKTKETARVFVMQSNGGITSVEAASRQPVKTVLSGPAGGVVGASAVARLSGFQRVITFDMGGTSTDVALVDGEPRPNTEAEVAGLPVRVPILDIQTVGAGGGSLARFDAGGALRVGPESAGADPGPICYGCGLQPTVTDANLLLGRLQPDLFLGGTFTLDRERTRAITKEWLKRQGSRLSVERFAEGVVRVVNAGMERALRLVSIERGHDPREFTLVAFGGAGGLHACELARSIGIPRVLVPMMPGGLSAYGILVSDIVKDYSRTVMLRVGRRLPAAAIQRQYDALEQQAQREFRDEGWQGKLRLQRSADMRYCGQGYELNVPYSAACLAEFHREHQARYGYHDREREVELVTVRLRARIKSPPVRLNSFRAENDVVARPQKRTVWFGGRALPTTVFEREQLTRSRRKGPAVLTEYSGTTIVPPGALFSVDRAVSVVIELARQQKRRPGSGALFG